MRLRAASPVNSAKPPLGAKQVGGGVTAKPQIFSCAFSGAQVDVKNAETVYRTVKVGGLPQ
jgi:hypothetical protein